MYRLKKNKVILTVLTLFCVLTLSSCSYFDNNMKKLKVKNDSFEYMETVNKISIQSTRDPSFRFTVTYEPTIKEIYSILESAKKVGKKIDWDADYIFSMYEGDSLVRTYNYVVNVEDNKYGNFYSTEENFSVSSRIDNDIIKNLANIRKPKDFETLYYKTIEETFDTYIRENSEEYTQINTSGVNIEDDVEILKYVLSGDLIKFDETLKKRNKPSKLITYQDDLNSFELLADVKTIGYTQDVYKSIITFTNKLTKTSKVYYVYAKYQNSDWVIRIGTDSNEFPNF